MLTLDACILMGYIHVPIIFHNVNGYLFTMSMMSTLFNVVFTLYYISDEANGMKEHLLEYVMIFVQAKLDWIPY